MPEMMRPNTSTLCDQFGLDSDKRKQRLRLLDLIDEDKTTSLKLVENVIRPNIVEIVDQFYTQLKLDPTTNEFISDDELLKRLKKTQSNYLLNLGIDYKSEAYFESRLRSGLAHAWVGLSPMIYQCSYYIQKKLINHYIKQIKNKVESEQLSDFLQKIVALDMSLAMEAYTSVQIQGFSQSLDTIQNKHRELLQTSTTDSLTKTLTRAQILTDLDGLVNKSSHDDSIFSIFMLDIDFFKRINDEYGHQTGDLVLIQLAKRFKFAIRKMDSVGRLGGEEFLILLPNADITVAQEIAARILTHVSSTPITDKEISINITVSIGITEYMEDDSAKTLIARADKSLYTAKNSGRNRIAVSYDMETS